jgi:hypothetical protein
MFNFIIKRKYNYYHLGEANENESKEAHDVEYLKSFGFSEVGSELVLRDREKLLLAYERAWQNRDFEINKFWSRAAYFWAFIAVEFGAYFALLTKADPHLKYVEAWLICVSTIFSVAWYFVILGSKRWQENWEAHIDMLENYVTGPLYKTIYYKGTFYSVSKINEVLSVVVFIVWIGILASSLSRNFLFPWDSKAGLEADFFVIIPIFMMCFFSVVIAFGYCRNDFYTRKNRFFRRDQ